MIYNVAQTAQKMQPYFLWLMDKFQERVRKLREKKGWAQEDLAREIDVSLSTVQRWEGKGAKPIRHARRELKRLFQEVGLISE